MSNISAIWQETLPSDGSLAVRGRQEIVDTWTAVARGLGEWMDFPGGHLKAGASRAFHGAASSSSYSVAGNAVWANRVFLASDESRLFLYDTDAVSQDTFVVGSVARTEHTGQALDPTGVQSFWGCVSGQTSVGAGITSGALRYTFNGFETLDDAVTLNTRAQFTTPPTVILTSSDFSIIFALDHSPTAPSSVSTGGFEWIKHIVAGADQAATIYWLATGPIHLNQGTGSQFLPLI